MTLSPECTMPRLPVLKPALRRLWRDGDTLQLGVEPRHAVVLAGLSPSELRFLTLLDGSRDATSLLASADTVGLDPAGGRRLIESLALAGLLDDAQDSGGALSERERQRLAPDRLSLSLRHPAHGAADLALARRRHAAVDVHGAGRVGAAVAGLLAAAGVGRLGCIDPASRRPADLSPLVDPEASTTGRGAAIAEGIRRGYPGTAARAEVIRPVSATTLAVAAPAGSVVRPETVAALRRRPHLVVVVRETTAAVGPFVVPGRTPCLRCVELARGERDPLWPSLAAQLVGAQPAVEPCDVALATFAASLATVHALAWIDAHELPPSAGGLLEFDLADGRLRRRSLAAHPACGCGAAG